MLTCTYVGFEPVLPFAVFPVGCQALLQDKPQLQVLSALGVESGAVQGAAAWSPSCAAASLSPFHAADQLVPSAGARMSCK